MSVVNTPSSKSDMASSIFASLASLRASSSDDTSSLRSNLMKLIQSLPLSAELIAACRLMFQLPVSVDADVLVACERLLEMSRQSCNDVHFESESIIKPLLDLLSLDLTTTDVKCIVLRILCNLSLDPSLQLLLCANGAILTLSTTISANLTNSELIHQALIILRRLLHVNRYQRDFTQNVILSLFQITQIADESVQSQLIFILYILSSTPQFRTVEFESAHFQSLCRMLPLFDSKLKLTIRIVHLLHAMLAGRPDCRLDHSCISIIKSSFEVSCESRQRLMSNFKSLPERLCSNNSSFTLSIDDDDETLFDLRARRRREYCADANDASSDHGNSDVSSSESECVSDSAISDSTDFDSDSEASQSSNNEDMKQLNLTNQMVISFVKLFSALVPQLHGFRLDIASYLVQSLVANDFTELNTSNCNLVLAYWCFSTLIKILSLHSIDELVMNLNSIQCNSWITQTISLVENTGRLRLSSNSKSNELSRLSILVELSGLKVLEFMVQNSQLQIAMQNAQCIDTITDFSLRFEKNESSERLESCCAILSKLLTLLTEDSFCISAIDALHQLQHHLNSQSTALQSNSVARSKSGHSEDTSSDSESESSSDCSSDSSSDESSSDPRNVTIAAAYHARCCLLTFLFSQQQDTIDPLTDAQIEEHITQDVCEGDARVRLMISRGLDNPSYQDAVNAYRGKYSPFRKFVASDIPEVWGVPLLRANLISDKTRQAVEGRKADKSRATHDSNDEPWCFYLADQPVAPYREEDMESLYYIRYSNSCRGHGVFAARDLPAGTVIGQYTGLVISDDGSWSNVDYVWEAPYKKGKGPNRKREISINALPMGNAMRFVNDEKYRLKNCDSVRLIKDNMWHVFYQTCVDVRADEELFVSYGSEYWEEHNQA